MADMPMRLPGQHVGDNEHISSSGTGTFADPFIIRIQIGDTDGGTAFVTQNGYLSVADMHAPFNAMLKELKKMNIQLAIITGVELDNTDLPEL